VAPLERPMRAQIRKLKKKDSLATGPTDNPYPSGHI